MFGLDERIATFSNGTTLLVVVAVSVLLGLRHAGDPDHLAAVTTMIASGRKGLPDALPGSDSRGALAMAPRCSSLAFL
jgi:hypothetical protein